MSRILAFLAAEIALLVTPMIWPTIPLEFGLAIYVVAGLLAIAACIMWWRETRKVTPTPLPKTEPSKTPELPTIEALSKTDFSDTLKVSQDMEYKELGYKARAHTCFNMDAHSKFLVVYFPRSPHVPNLIEGLADIASGLVEKMSGGGMKVLFKDPADITDVDVMSAKATNRVYVYHDDRLSLQDKARLDELYRDKGMSLVLRGPEYASSRWLTKTDAKQ